MKIKTFKHDKIEECILCKKIIHTDKDKWVALLDFDGDKNESVKFYHRFCLTDLINGQGRVIAKNFEDKLKKMAGGLMKNLQIKQNVSSDSKDKEITFEVKE